MRDSILKLGWQSQFQMGIAWRLAWYSCQSGQAVDYAGQINYSSHSTGSRRTNSLSRSYRPMTSPLLEYATLNHGMQNIARCRIRRELAAQPARAQWTACLNQSSVNSSRPNTCLQPTSSLKHGSASTTSRISCTGLVPECYLCAVSLAIKHVGPQPTANANHSYYYWNERN